MSCRLLIVDDEAPARRRLRELLADCAAEFPHQVVGEATNGMEAIAIVERDAPDLVLADMQMPRMGGIELARHLLKTPKPPAVIFVTAHDEFAVAAFEVNALDYLMKPVRAERLLAALQKAVARPQPPSDEALANSSSGARQQISISERGRLMLVPIADVVYLRAELKYITVRTEAREYLLEESLVHLEEEFRERFVRVHRSALVARDRITGFERAAADSDADGDGGPQWQVILAGVAERLPVSRRQWSTVKELVKGR
jgi:two-component system response regulator AlgR